MAVDGDDFFLVGGELFGVSLWRRGEVLVLLVMRREGEGEGEGEGETDFERAEHDVGF